MDEARDALMRGEPERVEHGAIVGVPFGDPVGAVAERVRGGNEVHSGGAGREHLLPFGNLDMRRRAADHGDDERRAGEPLALGLDVLGLGVRIFGAEGFRDRLAGGAPRLALKHDKAPRRELAVVRHPRSDREQGVEFPTPKDPAATAPRP